MGSEVDDELDAVNAFFGEDVIDSGELEGSRWLKVKINPDTAGHEALIHASLVVRLSLDRHYPQKPPSVAFESFSGVGDEEKEVLADLVVSSITSRRNRSAELAGDAALFDILDVCKGFVNEHNVPQEDCCICMCPFDEDEPFVKASCTHSFHCECLARWIHDQRVQADEKQRCKDVGEDGDEKEEKKSVEASCAVCRQPIQQDRMEILEKWLRPLYEEHVRKREKDTLAEAQRKAEAECEEMERRRRERKDRERKEMSEFRVQPLVVIDRYEHNNLKLLKHAMLPLGATDCRIVKIGSGQHAKLMAGVWFSCMDKAERAVRSVVGNARIGTYRDFKALPPDFVNKPH